MKRLFTLLVIILFLPGCSSHSERLNQAMKMRGTLNKAQGCRFTAENTADYGKEVYTFSMDCRWDNGGILTFEVVKPESISGITGKISNEGSSLTFDGKVLAFQSIADDYITPVTAPWLFVKTLAGGYIESVAKEDTLLHILAQDTYASESMTMDIWITEENLPTRAEMVWKGKRILTLNVKNFAYL